MSLRDHRDRAMGKRPLIRRMPRVTDIKMGTRIYEDSEVQGPEPEQCIGCGKWFSTDDLDNGYCGDCAPTPSGQAETEIDAEPIDPEPEPEEYHDDFLED